MFILKVRYFSFLTVENTLSLAATLYKIVVRLTAGISLKLIVKPVIMSTWLSLIELDYSSIVPLESFRKGNVCYRKICIFFASESQTTV